MYLQRIKGLRSLLKTVISFFLEDDAATTYRHDSANISPKIILILVCNHNPRRANLKHGFAPFNCLRPYFSGLRFDSNRKNAAGWMYQFYTCNNFNSFRNLDYLNISRSADIWFPVMVSQVLRALNFSKYVEGYPDQALMKMQECIALAQKIDHKLSLNYAQTVNAMIYQYRREAKATQDWAEKAMALSEEYGFPHWLAWTNVLRGWALVMQGQPEEGIQQIRQGLDIHHTIGSKLSLPTELGHLAEACLSGDQTEEGLIAVEEAFGEVHTRGEAWWSAELHRIKANLLFSQANKNQIKAASCFREAIAVAKEQNTKYFELHATTGLARLLHKQGSNAEAQKMLSEIYNWFTEGFDTTPLKEAQALLEELS